MITYNDTFTEIEEEISVESESKTENQKNLIVYNDEVNSFDYVIDCFVEICKHDVIQAEQCTYLVHYKGKCSVKQGSFTELEALCVALLNRGLTATIE